MNRMTEVLAWGSLVGAVAGMTWVMPEQMAVIYKASTHALFQIGQIALWALLVGSAMWIISWLTIALLGRNNK